jgi:hypothetical protein
MATQRKIVSEPVQSNQGHHGPFYRSAGFVRPIARPTNTAGADRYQGPTGSGVSREYRSGRNRRWPERSGQQ